MRYYINGSWKGADMEYQTRRDGVQRSLAGSHEIHDLPGGYTVRGSLSKMSSAMFTKMPDETGGVRNWIRCHILHRHDIREHCVPYTNYCVMYCDRLRCHWTERAYGNAR